MTRVGVFGAVGRMGSTVCRAVEADPELTLAAAIDPAALGRDLVDAQGAELPHFAHSAARDAMKAGKVEVAVDFTVHDAAMENVRWCAEEGVHAVVGTTGFSDADVAELREIFGRSDARCIIVPNFAIGAVLMMRFAEMAAAHMDAAEIVELHHNAKVDAPSGTSIETARRMEGARSTGGKGGFAPDPTTSVVLPGARGGASGSVRIHSVRLPGLVAHQEVIFGSAGETLSLRHDTTDRSSFMPGVLLAIKNVAGLPAGLTVGLEGLLGI